MRTAARLLLLPVLWASTASALEPSPDESAVAGTVTRLLERAHYAHPKVDAAASGEFLKNYLEGYDPQRMFFLRSDIEGFEARYGGSLALQARMGDLGPAYAVYDRFLQRLEERRATARELAASTFTFTAEESMPADRKDEPWPADAAQAREVWRLNVKAELLRGRLEKQKPEEPVKAVESRLDSLSDAYKGFDAEDVLEVFLDALCRVFDPHTDYFAASREEDFKIGMRLSLVGIGASLRSEGGQTKVVSLVPGGPADRDKRLKPNDRIEAVAQGDGAFVEVVGMRLDRVVALIRGDKGTVVRLRLIPADAIDPTTRVVLALTRDEVNLRDREAKAKLFSWRGPDRKVRRLGVIDLPSFYADMQSGGAGKSTTRDVETLLGALMKKGAEGLILDLRGNTGGALNEAVDLGGVFIGPGPVVQVRDGEGGVQVLEADGRRTSYGGPLVVLTSRGSASASEILAAALQDYGRAVVVGSTSTFGKGTVQTVLPLERYLPSRLRSGKAGSLHLTVQKFYRVSGGSTQGRGVVPDIRLPQVEDFVEGASEASLPHSLPYDDIPPATSPRFRSLGELRAASSRRVAASPEFAYRREDIALYLRKSKEKRVSLKESARLAEKAAGEAREARRKKERKARGPAGDEPLELTLEALGGVAKSTSTAEPPQKSTGTYEKAPPPPDIDLHESLNILSDLIRTR